MTNNGTSPIGDPGQQTLWEGTSQTLTGAATGGKVAGTRYRLTPWHLYIERGVVRTDSQQIPLVAVHDVDVKQSMTQKARGIGDVAVHVNHGGRAETILLEAIKEPKALRDLLNNTAGQARAYHAQQQRSQVNIGQQAPTPVVPASSGGGSVVEQLKELAGLRDAGVLTEEEFAAQKAKILS